MVLTNLDAGIVQGGVEHDDGEGEHVASVRIREQFRVQLTVALGKGFHHTVNLLRLTYKRSSYLFICQQVFFFVAHSKYSLIFVSVLFSTTI